MPVVQGKYKNPGWKNDSAPYLNAEELNAISDTLVGHETAIEEAEKKIKNFEDSDYIESKEKNAANGVAGLDESGHLKKSAFPYLDGFTIDNGASLNKDADCSITLKDMTYYNITLNEHALSVTLSPSTVTAWGFLKGISGITLKSATEIFVSGDDFTQAKPEEEWEFSIINSVMVWKKHDKKVSN